MLDSSPPSIVVGRTLSSYFVGGVQNNQETITYTVYNEQADDETGVLLTTTLQSGVTFASASLLPDMSGANLAWSLGTIQGFDRASVTLTVSLANPIPTQLDSGAQAFATLDAGAVSAATPAATLQMGNAPTDSSLLASTPDANTTDPFIQEEVAALNYDAVFLLKRAAERGGATRQGIRDYLDSVGTANPAFEGVAGRVVFDGNGDSDKTLQLAVIKDGKIVPLDDSGEIPKQ